MTQQQPNSPQIAWGVQPTMQQPAQQPMQQPVPQSQPSNPPWVQPVPPFPPQPVQQPVVQQPVVQQPAVQQPAVQQPQQTMTPGWGQPQQQSESSIPVRQRSTAKPQLAPNPNQMSLPFDATVHASQPVVTQPPIQVQSPNVAPQPQPQPQTPPQDQQASIMLLLRNFSKQAGCDRYTGDSERVKLLEDYLWLRQLTPSLPFETFLQLYTAVADFDDENLKHPADAIKELVPRNKKHAEEKKRRHWSAKEVVEYVALYVDIIRRAEATQSPVPMTLNQFLQNQSMIEQFVAGTFKEELPRESSRKSSTRSQKTSEKVRPSAAGQRAIHTSSSGRQFRGHVTALWQDQQSQQFYADFQSDTGEEIKGVGLITLEVCPDPPPNPPQTNEGDPLPELGHGRLLIPKANFPSVLQALSLQVPLGVAAIGDVVYSFNHQFPTGHVAIIDVVNAEGGPYVDARLCVNTPDNVVAEINEPRRNIEGLYTFETPEGSFTLEVTGNS